MVYKTRNRQLLVGLEPFPGTVFTPGTWTSNLRIISAGIQLQQGEIANEEARPGLGETAPRAGVQQGTISFEIDIAGSSTSGLNQTPHWDPLFEACGFRSRQLMSVTITAFDTGDVFNVGALFVGDVSGGIGMVAETLYEASGETTLYYYAVNGALTTSDTELQLTTGPNTGNIVTVTAQTPAQAGRGYKPSRPLVRIVTNTLSGATTAGMIFVGADSKCVLRLRENQLASQTFGFFEILYGAPTGTETFTSGATTFAYGGLAQEANPTLTLGLNEDGRLKTLRGCRGDVTIRKQAGMVPRMVFTFTGVYESIASSEPIVVTAYAGAVPPRFVSATIKFGSEQSITPVLDSLEVVVTNGVELRQDAGAAGGRREALGLQRSVKVNFDPEAIPESVWAAYTGAATKTAFAVVSRWGTPGTGNAFRLAFDNVVINTLNSGDRGGKLIDSYAAGAYQNAGDDEFSLLVV